MSAPAPPVIAALVAVTVQLVRLSIDLVTAASEKTGDLSEAPPSASNGKAKTAKKQTSKQFFEKSYGSVASTEEDVETLLEVTAAPLTLLDKYLPYASMLLHMVATIAFATLSFLATKDETTQLYLTTSFVFLLGSALAYRDMARVRFTFTHRLLYVLTALIMLFAVFRLEKSCRVLSILAPFYVCFSLFESYIIKYATPASTDE